MHDGPIMRTCIFTLLVLQLIAVLASNVAAVAKIETIVVSGPACGLLGLIIAALCYRRNVHLGFLFGLSAPTVAVLCFATIFGLQWSPQDAHVPIGSIIVLFSVFATPLGIFALLELSRAELPIRRLGLQYGLIQLLGLMFIVAVGFASLRTGNYLGAAAAVLSSYGALTGYAVHRFYAGRGGAAVATNGHAVRENAPRSSSGI